MIKTVVNIHNDEGRKFCPVGSRDKITYHYKVDKNGVGSLIADEKPMDWYGMIQSYKDSCDLRSILKRFKNGDVNALNRRPTQFFDSVDMPDDLMGVYNLFKDGEKFFNGLDPEIKSKFNNDYKQFLVAKGIFKDDKVDSKVDTKVDSNVDPKVESEVKVNE